MLTSTDAVFVPPFLQGSVDEMITSAKGLFDPALADEFQLMKINRCREVGLKCIERDPKRRPTMGNVLEMLNS